MNRYVQDDLIGVAVAGRRRPRHPAIAHPPKRIPGEQEHPQPCRDQRLAPPEPRPREPQFQQRPLALGHAHQRGPHLLSDASEQIHDGAHDIAADRPGARRHAVPISRRHRHSLRCDRATPALSASRMLDAPLCRHRRRETSAPTMPLSSAVRLTPQPMRMRRTVRSPSSRPPCHPADQPRRRRHHHHPPHPPDAARGAGPAGAGSGTWSSRMDPNEASRLAPGTYQAEQPYAKTQSRNPLRFNSCQRSPCAQQFEPVASLATFRQGEIETVADDMKPAFARSTLVYLYAAGVAQPGAVAAMQSIVSLSGPDTCDRDSRAGRGWASNPSSHQSQRRQAAGTTTERTARSPAARRTRTSVRGAPLRRPDIGRRPDADHRRPKYRAGDCDRWIRDREGRSSAVTDDFGLMPGYRPKRTFAEAARVPR
jgi:hypothetical protein